MKGVMATKGQPPRFLQRFVLATWATDRSVRESLSYTQWTRQAAAMIHHDNISFLIQSHTIAANSSAWVAHKYRHNIL